MTSYNSVDQCHIALENHAGTNYRHVGTTSRNTGLCEVAGSSPRKHFDIKEMS